MSGCHVPPMSGFTKDKDEYASFCVACKEKLPCLCFWQAIRDCQSKIQKLESNNVNLSVIITMNQTIETWERGCEILINNIQKRLADIESTHETQQNPSHQHLEKCLHEKNLRITELEQKLSEARNEAGNAIYKQELLKAENDRLRKQIDSIQDIINVNQTPTK